MHSNDQHGCLQLCLSESMKVCPHIAMQFAPNAVAAAHFSAKAGKVNGQEARSGHAYELWEGGNNPIVCQEEVIGGAQLPLCLVRFILALELGQAHDFGDARVLLQSQLRLRLLVTLT